MDSDDSDSDSDMDDFVAMLNSSLVKSDEIDAESDDDDDWDDVLSPEVEIEIEELMRIHNLTKIQATAAQKDRTLITTYKNENQERAKAIQVTRRKEYERKRRACEKAEWIENRKQGVAKLRKRRRTRKSLIIKKTVDEFFF